MTIARTRQISLDHTAYYHCTSRCVRRAFLCGHDRFTGRDFSHRRQWIENRLAKLASIFAIDLLAYAVMSNHYHVVIRIDVDRAFGWSEEEVVTRWGRLFRIPAGGVNAEDASKWRERLCSISWYMRCINEPLARWANREDDCVGRFWQGRFKAQALLDDVALLKCMTYVDLNPVRAGIASTPLDSAHTSVRARMTGNAKHLVQFSDVPGSTSQLVKLSSREYLHLVDWTGRTIRADKGGFIPPEVPPAVKFLRQDAKQWSREIKHYGTWYYRAVGARDTLERYSKHLGVQWLKGAKIGSGELQLTG
jgi:putative transposase